MNLQSRLVFGFGFLGLLIGCEDNLNIYEETISDSKSPEFVYLECTHPRLSNPYMWAFDRSNLALQEVTVAGIDLKYLNRETLDKWTLSPRIARYLREGYGNIYQTINCSDDCIKIDRTSLVMRWDKLWFISSTSVERREAEFQCRKLEYDEASSLYQDIYQRAAEYWEQQEVEKAEKAERKAQQEASRQI